MQATEQAGDLVVVVSLDTAAEPDQALRALQSSDTLSPALQSAGLRLAPDSLRVLPPATEE